MRDERKNISCMIEQYRRLARRKIVSLEKKLIRKGALLPDCGKESLNSAILVDEEEFSALSLCFV